MKARSERKLMESITLDTEMTVEHEQVKTAEQISGQNTRRPKRVKLTAEESLKRMQAFESERMEDFIASIRKSEG